jgi:hypothetical protein
MKREGGLKRLHRYPQPIDTTNESARLKFSKATRRTCAWNASANPSRRTIDWRFTTADARRIFGYKQSVRTSAARRST